MGRNQEAAPSADGEKKKEVIDLESEEGIKKKEMNARSMVWDHFIKIKEKGVVVRGKCKYCPTEIKAHPVLNGTSGLRKHFSVCKRNPHKCSAHATQGVLQVTEGTAIGTWKFDPDFRTSLTPFMVEALVCTED